MADLKISEMTPAAELTGAELIECVQGGGLGNAGATRSRSYTSCLGQGLTKSADRA